MKSQHLIRILKKMNIQEHPDSDPSSGKREFINRDGYPLLIPIDKFKSTARLMIFLIDTTEAESLKTGFLLGKNN